MANGFNILFVSGRSSGFGENYVWLDYNAQDSSLALSPRYEFYLLNPWNSDQVTHKSSPV